MKSFSGTKVISLIYSILIFIFGILLVPQKIVWGPENEKTITSVTYAPIWKLSDSGNVNGFLRIYTVDTPRLLVTLLVITLIMYSLYRLTIINHSMLSDRDNG